MYFSSFFARFLWKRKEVAREEFHYYSFISQVRLYIPSIDRKYIRLNNTMNKKRAIHS